MDILIRKSPVEDSELILIDIDGDTVWAETNKELLKEYILVLIDKL